MNYRHAFHAGNFADVFKHVVLTRVLVYLLRKDAALRVIDTHAGEGLYDISGETAEKTAEWRGGIGRLVAVDRPADVGSLLEPYLKIVLPYLAAQPQCYPGSPVLACKILRRHDRMIFCDTHPDIIAALGRHSEIRRDRRAKIVQIDGFVALNAFLPPPERRGVVLIDPPFEDKDTFERLTAALVTATRKWPTGTYVVWYPIKDPAAVDTWLRMTVSDLTQAGITKVLRLALHVDAPQPDRPLVANGLIVLNPPFVLEEEARTLLPFLAHAMGSLRCGADIAWLARD